LKYRTQANFTNSVDMEKIEGYLSHSLSKDVQRFDFSTENLHPGVYHYMLRSGANLVGDGKLMIVR